MSRFLKSEAGAVVAWVIGSLLCAAILVPWLHLAGKNLAAHVAVNDAGAFLEWLGAACGRAKFSRFFNRALLFSAIALLPLLIWRVRSLRTGNALIIPASQRLPLGNGLIQWCIGVLLAAGGLWILGWGLEIAGAFRADDEGVRFSRFVSRAVVPALGASIAEEWLFRGLLLTIWLRHAKPLMACFGTSLVFAFVHFLEPPRGVEIMDPNAAGAGFELLGHILLNFLSPQFLAAEFITLLAVGWILASAKIRTGSLWLPIGLHAGWVFAFKSYNLLHDSISTSPLRPWWIGESLRSGLLPLVTLVLTGWICHLVISRFFLRERKVME